MMNNPPSKDTYKSAAESILSSLAVPLSNLISQLIETIESSNNQDKISQKFLDFLSRITLFDSSIDCFIDRYISFLLINPNECFPLLFSNIPQVNLDMNPCFSTEKPKASSYLSRISTEIRNPTLLGRLTAFFVIDKLYIAIFLRFLEKIDPKSHPPLTCIFTKFISTFIDQDSLELSNKTSNKKNLNEIEKIKTNLIFKRKNEIEIRSLNIKNWTKIIHKLSVLQPIESFYFFVENLLNGEKNKQDLTFLFNLYRCFDFRCLSNNDLNSISKYDFFESVVKNSFQKVSVLTQYHVSSSLFLMTLVGNELIHKKRPNSLLIKAILNLVNDSFSVTPVALPIAAIFVSYFNDENKKDDQNDKEEVLNLKFSASQIVSNALNMMSQISGSSILILNTFSQLFQCNKSFFNDIYTNGIKISILSSQYSLITQERRQNIFQKIISYGSFNNALLELTNFFISFAILDFHSFVELNLKDMLTPIFMRFNSFTAFYFFREILLNETIKQTFPDDFSLFKENLINVLSKHIENNPPNTKERVIYSINSWIFNDKNQNQNEIEIDFDYSSDFEKQCCSNNFFIKHIFEFIEPKSVSFPSISTKIKNDVLLWSKLCCKKTTSLFAEEKNLSQLHNCKMLKENQATALLFSIIPLLNINNEKTILSIVPYIYDFSTQISAISVFVIQLSIRNNPVLIEKVIDLMINQEFDKFELLYNTLYYLSVFITAALSMKKNQELNSIMQNVFIKIQQLLIIGICSNRNEIRGVTFSVIDLLNINEFKIFGNDQCFKQFTKKLKAITFPASQNVHCSQLPFRSYRDVSQTKYETIHSIYLSVIFDRLKIKFEDNELKMINDLYHSIKLKLNDIEYKHFLINIITFLASRCDNDDNNSHTPNKLFIELNNFENNDHLLISYASSFNDVMSFTNYFILNLPYEKQFNLFPVIALILWERFPNDNTINVLLGTISKIIRTSFQIELNQFYNKSSENTNNSNELKLIVDNLNVTISILTLFSKMFSSFSSKHKVLSSSIFLRCSICEDIFRFCHCEDERELIFEFCLFCANTKNTENEGKKALETFCSVTTFVQKQLHYFNYLKNFPKAIRSIFCQSPQFIEFLLDQIKSGNNSLFSIIPALFYPISSILDSTDAIAENLNLLYYNYCCNEKKNVNSKVSKSSLQKDVIYEMLSDIDFSNIIYNLAGKIIALCLWNFPSDDSINTLLNLTLSFALIRVFLLNEEEKNLFKNQSLFNKLNDDENNLIQNKKEEKDSNVVAFVNDDSLNFAPLIRFLNNPTNNIQTLSNLLSSPFEFCLDQFLKESFDLLNKSFSSNFILALTPWMSKIDLNLEKQNDSLSPNTENYFKFCLTSITFVETIDKFKLYELIDMIINLNQENIESLFILGVYLKKTEIIRRIVKNAPKSIVYICSYFDCNFWRYQVVQLRKIGDKFYNEYTKQFLSFSSDFLNKNSNTKYSDNEDIFDVPNYLLKEVVPILIMDSFNELNFIFSDYQLKKGFFSINEYLNNSISSDFDEESEFINSKSLYKNNQKSRVLNIKSFLNHILTFCIVFEKNQFVKDFKAKFPHIFKFYDHNETTFSLLFEWATICGDIDTSTSALQYLVKNFDRFLFDNKSEVIFSEHHINTIIQTTTIITLSINDRNANSNNRITGDRQFNYIPYYTFISLLLKLLSIFNLKYYEQHKKSASEVNSKIFWFLCEFLVASDKCFGPIFGAVIESLYKHIVNNLPISDVSDFSPHKFNGIIPLIVKYNPIVYKNDCPQAIEKVIEISKILFIRNKFFHLIGLNNEKDSVFQLKKFISTAGLFLFPFCDYSSFFLDDKDDKSEKVLSKIIEVFEDEKINSIQKLVEMMIEFSDKNLIDVLFPFYFFISKNHPQMIPSINNACTIILNCKNVTLDCNEPTENKRSSFIVRTSSFNKPNSSTTTTTTTTKTETNDNNNNNNKSDSTEDSDNNKNRRRTMSLVCKLDGRIRINKDYFLRFIQNALHEKEISNASSACALIQSFHSKGGVFENYQVPPLNSKFPVENLPFDLDEVFDSSLRMKENQRHQKRSKFSNSTSSIDNESILNSNSKSLYYSEGDTNIINKQNENNKINKEYKFAVDLGSPPVYFPTDSEFLSLKFVVEIEEAACARCKIEPFSKWDEEIFNAERARDKIDSYGGQPLFDDFEASHNSELKFDFTKLFESRFYNKKIKQQTKRINEKEEDENDNKNLHHQENETEDQEKEKSANSNETENKKDMLGENSNETENKKDMLGENSNGTENKKDMLGENSNETENKKDMLGENSNENSKTEKEITTKTKNDDDVVDEIKPKFGSFTLNESKSGGGFDDGFIKSKDQKNGTFVMSDLCNRFRQFVKQSLLLPVHKNSNDEISQRSSKSEFSFSASSFEMDETKNSSQEFADSQKEEEEKGKPESLFFVDRLLFTPNVKDIDSIGPNSFPTVFPS